MWPSFHSYSCVCVVLQCLTYALVKVSCLWKALQHALNPMACNAGAEHVVILTARAASIGGYTRCHRCSAVQTCTACSPLPGSAHGPGCPHSEHCAPPPYRASRSVQDCAGRYACSVKSQTLFLYALLHVIPVPWALDRKRLPMCRSHSEQEQRHCGL